MRRYSQMTEDELKQMIAELEQEYKQALKDGWQSKADVIARKKDMAASYLLDAEAFKPGWYSVEGHNESFKLEYLNGVMAWGTLGTQNEVSFPISMLQPSPEKRSN